MSEKNFKGGDVTHRIARLQRCVLLALYDLSDGTAGVPVQQSEVWDYINSRGLHLLSDDEFRTYNAAAIERVKVLKARRQAEAS